MFSLIIAFVFALFSLVKGDCESYGVDFQPGGSYFINSLSSDNFTAVSQFEGCQGTAQIILVAPDESSWECSDVDASVDDVSVTTTCPIAKSDMYTGQWTLVILDNNGDDASYTGERTLNLTVGPQVTTTYTPTLTLSATNTSTSTSTVTSTELDTTTLAAVTVTTVARAKKGTVYVTPSRQTTWVSNTVTRTKTTTSVAAVVVTSTKAAHCVSPPAATHTDPAVQPKFISICNSLLHITSTVAQASATTTAISSAATTTSSVSSGSAITTSDSSVSATTTSVSPASAILQPFQRRRPANSNNGGKSHPPLRRRDAHLLRRAPDSSIITVTDTNTADFATSTVTITGPVTVITTTTDVAVTQTITPAAVTIAVSVTPTTVTLATPTRTRTTWIVTTSIKTKTVTSTVHVTTYTMPPSLVDECMEMGGTISPAIAA